VIAAVVLAAGAASRFGSPKQALLLEPVLARIRATAAVSDIVVVLGAHTVASSARVVHCPEWQLGPGASLRCGLAALGADVEAAVVVLADGPRLDPRAIDRVVAAWRAGSSARVAATYGGVRLHPVLLARAAWDEVPDAGLRALPAELVPADDLDPPGDVDFADQLEGGDSTEQNDYRHGAR
jgi:CTP:molybdopterin cytidylyltransferase MocA